MREIALWPSTNLSISKELAGSQSIFTVLILFAFITGNSSLEPLIEGLYAQIHVNLR